MHPYIADGFGERDIGEPGYSSHNPGEPGYKPGFVNKAILPVCLFVSLVVSGCNLPDFSDTDLMDGYFERGSMREGAKELAHEFSKTLAEGMTHGK